MPCWYIGSWQCEAGCVCAWDACSSTLYSVPSATEGYVLVLAGGRPCVCFLAALEAAVLCMCGYQHGISRVCVPRFKLNSRGCSVVMHRQGAP